MNSSARPSSPRSRCAVARPSSQGNSSCASDEAQLLFPCYDGLATAHLDLGDEGPAEEFMQKAQAVCERAGLEPDALVVLPFLD